MALSKSKTQKHIGLLVIGDEILSGKTKDDNIHTIANGLFAHGATLAMVRVVSDNTSMIVKNLRELLKQNDFVMTTGGIGPTHDDITAAAVAKALRLPLIINKTADKLLQDYYDNLKLPYNNERRKMAMMPRSATLLPNPISIAPGFYVKRTFVMAGVPRIMRDMFATALTFIPQGPAWWQGEVSTTLGEGTFANRLTAIQKKYKQVSIGSYPKFDQEKKQLWVLLTIKTLDEKMGKACQADITNLIQDLEKQKR